MDGGIGALGSLIKSMIKDSRPGAGETSKLPPEFVARVIKGEAEGTLLEWRGKSIPVKAETPVKEGEKLLLQLKEEGPDRQHFRIMARSPGEKGDSQEVNWHVLLSPGVEKQSLALKVTYYRRQKRDYSDEPRGPSLEISVQTGNLGLVTLRVSSLKGPYTCRFLVENREKGELLQAGLELLVAELGKKDIPVKILPYKVILPWEREKGYTSLFLDRKA